MKNHEAPISVANRNVARLGPSTPTGKRSSRGFLCHRPLTTFSTIRSIFTSSINGLHRHDETEDEWRWTITGNAHVALGSYVWHDIETFSAIEVHVRRTDL